MSRTLFTSPCCGHRTLSEPPGSHEICSVCFWEDDAVQLLDPGYAGGANGLSLMQCQANYVRLSASEERFRDAVRAPRGEERRDPAWRPARESDLRAARDPRELSPAEMEPVEHWYYWERRAT